MITGKQTRALSESDKDNKQIKLAMSSYGEENSGEIHTDTAISFVIFFSF